MQFPTLWGYGTSPDPQVAGQNSQHPPASAHTQLATTTDTSPVLNDKPVFEDPPDENQQQVMMPRSEISQPTPTFAEIRTTFGDKEERVEDSQYPSLQNGESQEMVDVENQALTHSDTVIPSLEAEKTPTQDFGVDDHQENLTSGNTPRVVAPTDMQFHEPSGDRAMLARYLPSDTVHTAQRRRPEDRSSAPPECLRVLRQQENVRRMNYLDRFCCDILPPPTAPLYTQIITYMQRWGVWSQFIDKDERRQEVITAVADRMENIWIEGMKMGLIPQAIPAPGEASGSDLDLGNQMQGQTNQDALSAQQIAADIMGAAGRGRRTQQQPRRKRPVSPSRVIVLRRRRTEGPDYGITAGELEEAGLTMEMVRERVASGDLDEEDEIMNDVLEQVDREVIDGPDWYAVLPKTKNNIIGRDLMVYCLWEVQNCRAEIESLNDLMNRFTHQNQKRNTQLRINAEMELQNQFLALALILHERDAESTARSPSEDVAATTEAERAASAAGGGVISINRSPSPAPSAKSESDSGIGETDAEAVGDGDDRVADDELDTTNEEPPPSPTRSNSGELQTDDVDNGMDDIAVEKAEDEGIKPKRGLELEDDTNMQPSKRLKLLDASAANVNAQVEDVAALEGTHMPDNAATDFTPASMSSSLSTNRSLEPQTQQFIDSTILPRLNELLSQAGQDFITEGTPWRFAKVLLRSAGISPEIRNEFAREIKDFQTTLREETMETQEQSKCMMLDAPDLPSRHEIVQSIPVEGLSPQQFFETFKARVDPNDQRWPQLVRSVAYRDKARNRWFVLNGLAMSRGRHDSQPPVPSASPQSFSRDSLPKTTANAFDRLMGTQQASPKASTPATTATRSSVSHDSWPSTPKIKLSVRKPELKIGLKTKKGFNPRDYSVRAVNNTKGFRWRYLKGSTIAERDSMDDVISTYVRDRVDFDREKKKEDGDVRSLMPDRFGTYEVLAHPKNPAQSVVHGVWDYRNKTKVAAAKWFYEGKDGEWTYPVKTYDAWGYLYTENQRDLDAQAGTEANAPKKRSAVIELDGTIDDDQPGPSSKGGRKAKGKGKAGKGGKGSTAVPPPPAPPPQSMINTRKRKAEMMQTERPKRRAAQRGVRYVVEEDDGSDEEWQP